VRGVRVRQGCRSSIGLAGSSCDPSARHGNVREPRLDRGDIGVVVGASGEGPEVGRAGVLPVALVGGVRHLERHTLRGLGVALFEEELEAQLRVLLQGDRSCQGGRGSLEVNSLDILPY
jgi:hypothetical protein